MRPRFTHEEILFVLESLKLRETWARQKQTEMEQREWRIKELRKEWTLTGNREILQRIHEERNQLLKDRQADYINQQTVARCLVRRLEGLLQNRRLHSANRTSLYLKMEPNQSKKSHL